MVAARYCDDFHKIKKTDNQMKMTFFFIFGCRIHIKSETSDTKNDKKNQTITAVKCVESFLAQMLCPSKAV